MSKIRVFAIEVEGDADAISAACELVRRELSFGGPQSDATSSIDEIRERAAKDGRSNFEICDLATRVLGRVVITLERLSAHELARVYEAVCATSREADRAGTSSGN